jgi:hypothetical protein
MGKVLTRFHETNPGWMLLIYLYFLIFQTSIWFIAGSIILIASRENALDNGINVKRWNPPDPHRPRTTHIMSMSTILSKTRVNKHYFLRFFFVIWHSWQVKIQQLIFNIFCKSCPYHGIPDILFCYCLSRWSQYSWCQEIILCLNHW